MIERAERKKDLRSRSRLGRVGVGSGVCPEAKGHERERECPKSQSKRDFGERKQTPILCRTIDEKV